MTLADRIVVLNQGQIEQVGSPLELYRRPANLFVAGFIGSPPMNLAQAPVERADGGLAVPLGDTRIQIPPDLAAGRGLDAWTGRQVIVGIRPEDLQGSTRDGGGERRAILQGKLERVEALGASLLGYFSVNAEAPKGGGIVAAVGEEELEEAPLIGAGGTLFCATFEPRSAVRIGDSVEVVLDVDRLHFFDPQSEVALGESE
jgi:multiple sugar transport system ATP-binding protein